MAKLRALYARFDDAGRGNGTMAEQRLSPQCTNNSIIVNGNLTSIGQAEYCHCARTAEAGCHLHTAGYSLLGPHPECCSMRTETY